MSKSGRDDAEQVAIFFEDSDETIEHAGGSRDTGVPTLVGTYCFTCPSGQEVRAVDIVRVAGKTPAVRA